MKRKYILLFFSILILATSALLIYLNRSGEDRDYPEISKAGVLTIVTDYSATDYYVSGDTIAGFNHDLITLLEKQTGLKIEVQLESSLDKSIAGLKSGKYDILASNTPTTTEMKSSLNFTEPIIHNRQVLIQRKKEFNGGVKPIRSLLDLAEKTLYVPINSPVILRIKNLSHEIGDTIYIQEDPLYEAEQLLMMVASKEIDYAVCDEKTAKQLAKSIPEIDDSTLIGFTHFEAWAVRQSSLVLLDSLNVWIEKLKKTEQFNRLYNKYYK